MRKLFGGVPYRPSGKNQRNSNSGRSLGVEFPRVEEIRRFLSLQGQFVCIGMRSSQQSDYEATDIELGKIKQVTAAVIHRTVAGKEPRAAWREFGVPPAVTFTRVFEAPEGGLFYLASNWKREGMPTLCGDLRLYPPPGEDQRRQACYFGAGPESIQSSMEGLCLDWLDPVAWSKGFGPDSYDGVCHFYLMVEMFRPEVAGFLGLPSESPEMDAWWQELVENAEATANVEEKKEVNPNMPTSWLA